MKCRTAPLPKPGSTKGPKEMSSTIFTGNKHQAEQGVRRKERLSTKRMLAEG